MTDRYGSKSADQLAEKMRMGLRALTRYSVSADESLVALDALLARLAEAEKERDAKPWIRMWNAANTGDETLYRITADDRIEFGEALEEVRVRFEAAEAERDRLKAALEQIAALPRTGMPHTLAQRIARAALAAGEAMKEEDD